MASQPRDYDQSKKSNPENTPKRPIPNMSIDEPEQVFEAEPVPVVEPAPESAVEVVEPIEDEPLVLSSDDAVEEITEVAPESAVLLADDAEVEATQAERPEPQSHPQPVSDVVAVEDAMPIEEVAPIEEAAPVEATPEPEVDMAAMLGSAYAPPETPTPVIAEAPVEVQPEPAPEPDGLYDLAEEIAEPAPESAVEAAEEIAEAAPVSDVTAAEEIAEAAPASGVVFDEAVEEAAPASAVEAIEEAAPASAVEVAEEIEEAAPASGVVFDEAVEEAVPASAIEAAEEVAEVAPSSDVLADEIAEAAPVSEVKSAVEAVEAVDEMDELGATEFMDGPLADAKTPAEEAVLESETKPTGSSAVLFDEVGEESPAKKTSADFDKTVAFDGTPGSAAKKDQPDSLVTEEEVIGADDVSSAVDLGEMPGRKSSAKGIDKVAEALESGVGLDSNEMAATQPPEPSVEFDEILDESEAKIDDQSTEMDAEAFAEEAEEAEEVAEAVEADEAEAIPADEDPLAVEDEAPAPKSKTKATTGDDIDLDELFGEDEAVAEAAEALEPIEDAAAEGVELDAVEEDVEPSEAVEAEAAEAFDEEVEAVEAAEGEDEVKPTKKTKAKKGADEDEEVEAVAAVEDDEEDTSAKKKKGKKDKKEKATVAPPAPAPSGFLRIMIGMFLMLILIGGLGAAGYFFAPDENKKDVAQFIYEVKQKDPPKVDPRTILDKQREELAKGNFDEVVKSLAAAPDTDEASLDLRGQAKWFGYVKAQAGKPLDAKDATVQGAIADLNKSKNVAMIAQINATLKEKELADELAKTKAIAGTKDDEIKKIATDLANLKGEKEKVEKVFDDVAQVLVDAKLIKDKAKIDAPELKNIVKGLTDKETTLAAVNKILADGKFGEGEEGLNKVLKLKKEKDDAYAAVNDVLDKAKVSKGAKGAAELAADRDDLVATLALAFKELIDGKIITDAKADPRKDIVKGVQDARKKAESPLSIPIAQIGMSLGSIGTGTSKTIEDTFKLAKVATELSWYKTREEFIQTPQQKMSTYVTLLQDRGYNTDLDAILKETKWVMSPESKSEAESRAKAQYVRGLVFRNQKKFAEAKAEFDATVKALPPADKSGWGDLAKQSQRELTDPAAYYLPLAERQQSDKNFDAAIETVNTGLEAIPGDARLYAQRGHIRLGRARAKGEKFSEVVQKGIREDAEFAGKDDKLKAESMYLVGLLEEELGNWTEAEKQLRAAIKASETDAEAANRYRVALGRLLLRDRTETVPTPAPADDEKKKADKVGAIESEGRVLVMHPWSPLVVASLIGQDSKEDMDDPGARETLKLAEEIIASGIKSKNAKIEGQGYLLKGSALSKLNQRTEGLKLYAKGLKMLFPGIEIAEMNKLIDEHPAFPRPDTTGVPNPVMAERHFGDGMHFYWSKQYAEAEVQFGMAVRYYDKDARYQYFLGLAQHAQGTKEKRGAATFSFEEGARLEARAVSTNPLAVRDINASLERIQGDLRTFLNGYRYKATPAEPEAKTKGL